MASKIPPTSKEEDKMNLVIEQLSQFSKFKERSDVTHDTDHAPVISEGKPVTCLLLGHSFFERFKTTGADTRFGPAHAPYPEFFNAGVGGDQISNIIYRLNDKGLLFALKVSGVKYALLAMGTNDLASDRKPLQQHHIEQYSMIVHALQWACPGVRVLVCGLAPKKRVKKEGIVEESNDKLQAMVRELTESSDISVEYMPSDPELIHNLEPDGVHLNARGYEMFADSLWEAYQAMRTKYEQ